MKDQDRELAETYQRLAAVAEGDAQASEVLAETWGQVQECRPMLMLLPEVGLVDFLIDNIEAAAGTDNGQRPGEQALRDRLVRVRNELSDTGGLDESDWRRIEAVLSREDLPNFMRGSASYN